jgi:predicted dehydrogenase
VNYDKNIAVIGAGYWGKNLIRNYHELGALRTICDTNEKILPKFKEQYKETIVTSKYNDVISDPDVRAVVIALPAELHYRYAKQALQHNKHVYVEKPLTIDVREAEDLVAVADNKKMILMVGHLLQYHPVFVKLKEIIRDNALGKIQYIYSNRLSLGKIRREENVLWSFAPHDISMILSLCGEEPSEVYATGAHYLQHQIYDVTTTHMSFPSGIHAHIFVSWLHPFKEQKLIVIGEKKMAVFSDTEEWGDKLLVYPHEIEWKDEIPVPRKADAERIHVEESEPLKSECAHFLECVAHNKKPITDGEEGLRVLKVLNLAQKSLEKSKM